MTVRVLCLDIEGGYGGSSRSLYESIRHLPDDIEVEVWCRRKGPIGPLYDALGVVSRVTPEMPHISSLPRFSRNLFAFSRFGLSWRKSAGFRKSLIDAARSFDAIHFNHEGLFLLARWLRPRVACAFSMHVRTFLPITVFSRWQYRNVAKTMDHIVFITENEAGRVAEMTGREPSGSVVYNIARSPENCAVHPGIPRDGRLNVAVLSNYAWIRGIDRLVDVAEVLAGRGRNDIHFVVAGDMTLKGKLQGRLGALAREGRTLADYAEERGVKDAFTFLGHVDTPESVLAGCDLLAKPTREANPWGRDIIEALAAGRPVLSIGTYDRFVETGVTGVLTAAFDAQEWAEVLEHFADDREALASMGEDARQRVAQLCNGETRAADLAAIWRSITGKGSERSVAVSTRHEAGI